MSFDEYFEDAQIPFEEIELATNNFSDENLIAHGGVAKVFKGQLLRSGEAINVAVRSYPEQTNHIYNEINMFYNLKHKNVVSMVGFHEDRGLNINIIVTKLEANRSLDEHLSSPTLMWIQRLHICVGVAHALSYIHHDMGHDQCLIHGNVKSSKILLDENWEPKLSGFGCCMKIPCARRHHILLTSKYNTSQYMDPQYEKTGGVTQKSDVFSFGVVLFEVLFGKKASIPDADNWYFARLARLHYEEKTLDHMIDPNLRKQMDFQSLKIFSELAYFCLKEQRSHRPSIDHIVKKLERALELQWIHENPSTDEIKDVALYHLKGLNLEHLKIPLTDIRLATENFAEAYRIGSGGYGIVYKAELDHFDGTYSSSIEGNNKGKLRKKRSTVAIKRIFSREDKQGEVGFVAEIEMLSSCKHRNVVSLLGFCDEGPQKILVYEHASKGSLDDHLGNTDFMTNLTWAQRIKICLEIAHGLDYLHSSTEDKRRIIHRDIKSANILLHDNWEVKIADFGLSKLHPMDHQGSTLNTCNIAGTEVYLDPEYMKTGKLKKESDIYSFGVVLFEIMCGRLAYDEIYNLETEKGLPSVVRRRFNEGTLKQMVDPKLVEDNNENIFTRNSGLNQDSLHTFSKVAYQCLAKTQTERPKMEVIIKELEKSLYLQENSKDNLQISLENIRLATENFSDKYYIGEGLYWKAYLGHVPNANGLTTALIKRLDKNEDSAEHRFLTELEILLEYKHDNIIGLVGYCNEEDEKIILYELVSRGSLSMHLKDASVNWIKRLKLCIDVASALEFIHGGTVTQQRVIHRDINSDNIIVNEDWIAKISNFDGSLLTVKNEELDYANRDDSYCSSLHIAYMDPLYHLLGLSGIECDIYSLGVVLCEIMSGISAVTDSEDTNQYLGALALSADKKGKLDEMVFEGIKEQIVPQSLTTFQWIAIRCLKDPIKERPPAGEVVIELKKALEFQEDYEIWEPKLPKGYKEIIQMSKTPDIYSTEKRKNLYDIFTKGILLQKGTVLFSLGSNGERNEMISATKFSYKNRWSHKWRSIPESRFQKVAEMLDISNMKIQIRTRTQFLSPGVNYRVHLVFKFCGPRKSQAKRMYVNLKYKRGNENLNAYFATWREDEWMMIELFRFLNNMENTEFEVQLESFSRCYCGSRSVYIQGIEFQAVPDVKHEETEKLNEIGGFFRSNSNTQQVQQFSTVCEEASLGSKDYDDGEKLSLPSEVMRRKCHILPATEFLYDTSNVKLTNSKQFQDSSFQEMIELPSQQVFHIKCKIQSQILSPNTEYDCYLVFKLLEKFCKLHCPVIVRNLLHRKSKEAGILYFRSPGDLNQHDFRNVPKERNDGWMEVKVWKFNLNHDLKNDCLHVNLKLISYEGTMSGLIVCGLEFRPS